MNYFTTLIRRAHKSFPQNVSILGRYYKNLWNISQNAIHHSTCYSRDVEMCFEQRSFRYGILGKIAESEGFFPSVEDVMASLYVGPVRKLVAEHFIDCERISYEALIALGKALLPKREVKQIGLGDGEVLYQLRVDDHLRYKLYFSMFEESDKESIIVYYPSISDGIVSHSDKYLLSVHAGAKTGKRFCTNAGFFLAGLDYKVTDEAFLGSVFFDNMREYYYESDSVKGKGDIIWLK